MAISGFNVLQRKFFSEIHNLRIIFLLLKHLYHPTNRASFCLFLYCGPILLKNDQFFRQDYLDLCGF